MLQLHRFLSALTLCIKSNKFFFVCTKTEFILRIIKLLIRYNYVIGFKTYSRDKKKITVFLKLNFERSRPFITACTPISTCSRPLYVKAGRWPSDQASLLVLSTPKGLLGHKEALASNVGGLVLFKII